MFLPFNFSQTQLTCMQFSNNHRHHLAFLAHKEPRDLPFPYPFSPHKAKAEGKTPVQLGKAFGSRKETQLCLSYRIGKEIIPIISHFLKKVWETFLIFRSNL
jgi:hypothetical protein